MKITNLKKKALPVLAGAGAAVASCVPVFAAEGGTSLSTVETALTSSFTEIGSSMTSIVGKILPIVLPVLGVGVLIGFGVKYFKKIANKA